MPGDDGVEDVVIIGAGIAGLATALALQRVGCRCRVLERHAELRATGAAISLLPNAMRALTVLGVADKLMSVYTCIKEIRINNVETGKGSDMKTAMMSVHRKTLLDVLADELPAESIEFSSKVVSIESDGSCKRSLIMLHLDDGTVLRTRLLIGCDGVNSVVARWLGFSKPIHSGRSAVRGLAVYPSGHGFRHEGRRYLATRLRAGLAPISRTDVYWFIVSDSDPSEQEAANDPRRILEQVEDKYGVDLPDEFWSVVRLSDESTVTWAPLVFRSPLNILFHRGHRAGATVAGDALHPMTPDLAQGGGSALEDAVVLARSLANASSPVDGIAEYVAARRWRVAWIVACAFTVGWLQHAGGAFKWFRDRVFFPFVFPWIAATMRFDCGPLPPAPAGGAPQR